MKRIKCTANAKQDQNRSNHIDDRIDLRQTNKNSADLVNRYRNLVLRTDSQTKNSSDSAVKFFDNKIGYNVIETAFLLGISSRTVERAIKRRTLNAKRLGRRVIIPRQSIEAWLNRKD